MRLLLICGSTRDGSSNALALRALQEIDLPDLTTDYYTGLRRIPAFVPEMHPVPAAVRDLLRRIAEADAVMFSTPEYAGGLPGALKNLLDWTVGGGELYRKPAAWIDVANPDRGQGARAQLATVLGYVGAHIVTAACVHVTLLRVDGTVTLGDPARQELATAAAALVAAAEEDT